MLAYLTPTSGRIQIGHARFAGAKSDFRAIRWTAGPRQLGLRPRAFRHRHSDRSKPRLWAKRSAESA